MASKQERGKKHYLNNRDVYFWNNIKNKFGLTKESYHNMILNQDFKCVLCGTDFRNISQRFIHIDHCHETDTVRGILCMKCNVGLGMLGDNEEGLLKALQYVRGEI